MLQRTAGNRATARLLQPARSNAARLAKIARQLNVAAQERDVHLALRLKEGQDEGVRPGLNIVNNLATSGRTGFVDADGRYRGDFLTPTRDGARPAVAIMLSPRPFTDGDDSVLATLRHELVHAEHDQMILGWLAKWRSTWHGADFAAWMRRQKVSAADRALVQAGKAGKAADTELLAHIEGFAAAFEKTPSPSAPVVLKSALPQAIEQLRGAADRGWIGVDEAVKTVAAKRLADYYQGLDAARQALLRDWLFYLRYRAATPWPKEATDDEARAARIVRQSFQPHLPFLDWMLAIIRGLEFTARQLPGSSDQAPVSAIALPKAARTATVRRGKVRAYLGVAYEFRDDSRSHGISLSYEGPDAQEMRWLQFIWREVVPDHGRPVEGKLYHQQESYPLTTNPVEPSQVPSPARRRPRGRDSSRRTRQPPSIPDRALACTRNSKISTTCRDHPRSGRTRPSRPGRGKDLPPPRVFPYMQYGHRTSDDFTEAEGSQFGFPVGIDIRPLEPRDRAGLAALFERLSPESRRRRFLTPKPELSSRELTYFTNVDHRWHEALAAVDRRDGSIVAVARYVGTAAHPSAAEAAVAVADDMQRRGIGTALARCLAERARANGFDVLTASTLWENRPARALLRRLGFRARASEGNVIELEQQL